MYGLSSCGIKNVSNLGMCQNDSCSDGMLSLHRAFTRLAEVKERGTWLQGQEKGGCSVPVGVKEVVAFTKLNPVKKYSYRVKETRYEFTKLANNHEGVCVIKSESF